MDKETIYDIPTTARLKVMKGFDLWSEFDDEMIEDYRDFMSWFMRKNDELLNYIPVKGVSGFFVTDFEESAFNTCDFQKGKLKLDRYGYRIRKVMERIDDLAMRHSCIIDESGRRKVKRMCQSVIESEFLIEALEAQREGDRGKAKRLMERIDECAKVWEGWNPA